MPDASRSGTFENFCTVDLMLPETSFIRCCAPFSLCAVHCGLLCESASLI